MLVVRQIETDSCDPLMNMPERSRFQLEEIDFEQRPMREQTALFYATAVPLKILSITRPT